MNEAIEELTQSIGREALDFADGLMGKLLIHAEIDQDSISADMFYVNSFDGSVRFKFCSMPLVSLIRSFWEEWAKAQQGRSWKIMDYLIDGDKFNINYTYLDKIPEDEDESDRRLRIINFCFGNVKVDYSKR